MASRPRDGSRDGNRPLRERDGLLDRLATGVALLAVVALIAFAPLA
jgi:hypothetical protein